MRQSYIKSVIHILQQEGLLELCYQSKDFMQRKLTHQYHKLMMKIKYGGSKPVPNKILFVTPTRINHRISDRYLPDNHSPYGIIDGDWDLKKSHWKNEGVYYHINTKIFYGLIERFEEKKEWEDTVYYQTGVEFLKRGEHFPPLDGPQTMSGFRNYLDYLDRLYEDIKENGYDMSSIIKVHIGREGEFIVAHGQHRLTIARIIEVNEVPVRVQYRHKQWQELRKDVYYSSIYKNINKKLQNHPDMQDVLK